LLVKLAQCFSVVRNVELLSVRAMNPIPCLDGLRVMSFALLMFGQTALAMFQSDNLGHCDFIIPSFLDVAISHSYFRLIF